MLQGRDKAGRKEDAIILKGKYSDYDPRYHDAFVWRYNRDMDRELTYQFMVNRGIIKEED